MAGTGLWVKVRGDQLSHSSFEDDNEDIWDDTALIEAYDRAVNSFKTSFKDKKNADTSHNRQKWNKKKSKHHVGTKWRVGDKCQAIYHEDGLIYEGEIIDIQDEGESCTVRFDYYENEEVVRFEDVFKRSSREKNIHENKRKSAGHKKHKDRGGGDEYLQKDTMKTVNENEFAGQIIDDVHDSIDNGLSISWAVGDICYAPNPRTGIWEEAVLTSVEAESCAVTFIRSNFNERVDAASLRPRFLKKKHCRHACQQHKNKGAIDGKCNGRWPSYFQDQSFPPPDFMTEHAHLIPPPPPPIGMPIDAESDSDNALASMLMSWYMVGYHTGYYQGIRSKPAVHNISNRPEKQHNRTDPVDMYSE